MHVRWGTTTTTPFLVTNQGSYYFELTKKLSIFMTILAKKYGFL